MSGSWGARQGTVKGLILSRLPDGRHCSPVSFDRGGGEGEWTEMPRGGKGREHSARVAKGKGI